MTARTKTPPQEITPAPVLYLLPLLVVRVKVALPDDVARDRDAAAEYTLRLSREKNMRACLVWDRRWSYQVMYSRATNASTDTRLALDGVWVERSNGGGVHARIGGRPVVLSFE